MGRLAALLLLAAAPQREISVGMPARLEELVLPGSELEVAPIDPRSPVMVRILAARPHGDAFRYDLEYWGLDPGTWNLAARLRRKDGSSSADLPAVEVTVSSILPPGQVTPHPPPVRRPSVGGGYTSILVAGAALWLAGLTAIVRGGRRRREEERATAAPETLADRLRPLVQRALEGELSAAERSRLELLLVAYWRRRLGLEHHAPLEVLKELRGHPEASPLIEGLERWLHNPASREQVDVAALLAPYRELPADALDPVPAGSAHG